MATAELYPMTDGGHGHLRRLMGWWGMLADLCFADLLLFVPVIGSETSRFMILGQMRPTTGQTLHRDDLVGSIIDEAERPLVARSLRAGEIVEGELIERTRGERARIQCIPVRFEGEVIAVMTRESPLIVGRRTGELERVYVEMFERFARMIIQGTFPYPTEETASEEAPRVGDGVLVLDAGGRVEYSSPNAINALHRMGIYSNAEGMRLDELGVEETAVQRSFFDAVPIIEEIERQPGVTVSLRCIPIIEGDEVSGALVLLRDVTDLRRRDRLLISKDASIREVHHRIKNNLQTISSLLRLQGRRLPKGGGRTALEEAERRIRSIALVHEILSRDAIQEVDFREIIGPLVRMAKEGVLSERAVQISVDGDAGVLPAEMATPLAMAVTELLQNAVEHAFPEDGDDMDGHVRREDQHVELVFESRADQLGVTVSDNGRGLPEGFSIETTTSLGLSIVRDLVRAQLGGTIEMVSDGGTRVELSVPLNLDES